MALRTFQDYIKIKDGEPSYPFSEPISKVSICADTDGDTEGAADLGSPGMGKKLEPLEPVTDKAEPEYKKDGKLKSQKNESIEKKDDILNEEASDNFLTSHVGEKFTPSLSNTTAYISKLAKGNKGVHERLVRDFKRNGTFDGLMEEIMNHPETFSEVAKHLSHAEHGKKHSKKLVNALKSHRDNYMQNHAATYHESVDAPRGDPGVSMGGDYGGGMGTGLGTNMNPVSAGQTNPVVTNFGTPNAGNVGATSFAPQPAMNLPPANESKMKLGHDNLLESMASVPEFKSKMMECCGMY